AILERALKACVDQGMASIEKPVISVEEYLPVAGDETANIVYRKVGMALTGPYEAFQGVLGEFQKPDWPLQVRLLSLGTKGSAAYANLRGQMEFVGLFLETGEEEPPKAPEKPAPPRKGTRKKKVSP